MTALRAELLIGRAVALAGDVGDGVRDALVGLGARVETLPPSEVLAADEERVGDWARAHDPLDALVYDVGSAFADGGPEALVASMEGAWVAIREVANGALIPADAPGKVLLIGPRPGAGAHAGASARAGANAGAYAGAASAALENLARTLSVEWARYGITTAMLAPGDATTEAELAELVCFLVSPAGDYLSGCRLELGAVA
jgi:NAD(P)-dependent dehydrogenase (short-subunit alcohol dehydrogenase family)